MAKKKDKKDDTKKERKGKGSAPKTSEQLATLRARVDALEKQVVALAGALDEALRSA